MRKTAISLFVLSVVLVLALVGCTDSGSSTEEAEESQAAEQSEDSAETDGGDEDLSYLLTPADVEAVTGMTGLVAVPYDPSVGAGGEVNIADAEGELVVMLSASPGLWESWQSDGMTVDRPSDPTVGDESFLGPKDSTDEDAYILGFRMGDMDAAVVAFFDISFERSLTLDQMYELAEIVESRL